MATLSSETRNDLHLTSTGVGHALGKTPPFPPSDFKATRTNPLPTKLTQERSLRVDDVYQTTTAVGHKPMTLSEQHVLYKKAPGSWKVHHNLDVVDKLNRKPWRPPLTTGNQSSEMKAKYRANPESISSVIAHSGNPQPPTLADHFNNGPTKELTPSTFNQQLKGRSFVPQNQAILDRLEPYMTSNNWYHRTFSKSELNRYPKKDVATYWQCEDYPKAWGHGMRKNLLPRKLSRTDPGPLRDRTVFKTGTTIPRLPKSLTPVTNGLKSTYSETYANYSQDMRRRLFHCPVNSAVPLEGPDTSLLQTVPHMYKTMNMTYGDGPIALD